MNLKLLSVVFFAVGNSVGGEKVPSFEVRGESPFEETTDIRFLYQCVDQHNEYRRANTSSLLFVFNRDVENYARRRLTKMAESGKLLPPDPTSPFEENAAWTPTTNPVDCRTVVDHWFYDVYPYLSPSKGTNPDAKNPDRTIVRKSPNPRTGDFIWRQATDLGCAQAVVHEPRPGTITVCNYYSSKFKVNKKFASVPEKSGSLWSR